jgi:hypothetical protein
MRGTRDSQRSRSRLTALAGRGDITTRKIPICGWPATSAGAWRPRISYRRVAHGLPVAGAARCLTKSGTTHIGLNDDHGGIDPTPPSTLETLRMNAPRYGRRPFEADRSKATNVWVRQSQSQRNENGWITAFRVQLAHLRTQGHRAHRAQCARPNTLEAITDAFFSCWMSSGGFV